MTEPRDILQALFVGDDIGGADIASTARAAQQDVEVRALFDKLALADREFGGDFEARFGEAWFGDSLDEMLAEEAEARPNNVVVLDQRRWTQTATWIAAAAAVLLAVGVGYRSMNTGPEFQARSAGMTSPSKYEMPSVEVFCVERDGDEVKFIGAEQAELATVRCSTDQEIKLAVRNPDARLRFGAFFGIGADNSLYWYGPSPAATQAVAVPATSKLTPIGETIRLDVNHAPGTVRLVGVFVEEPMDWSAIERWATTHRPALRDGNVDVPGGVVVRQTFEVTQ